jgi:hypothetical protein
MAESKEKRSFPLGDDDRAVRSKRKYSMRFLLDEPPMSDSMTTRTEPVRRAREGDSLQNQSLVVESAEC